jgi:predicted nuclease of predicted toxin-antitoxin system
MRLLLDQDVFAATARFLRDELGHDVLTAAQADMSRSPDSEFIAAARETDRVLVTRDRHFGALVFVGQVKCGVIYLRFPFSARSAGHAELQRVMSTYPAEQLRSAFVTVEPGRHRFRRLQH